MNDANDNENGGPGGTSNPAAPAAGGRAPLTLKPRIGAVSAGTVKQSFSHGRSKTVLVETKRRRVDGPGPAPAPVLAEKRPVPEASAPEAKPARPPLQSNLNLSAEELQARQRVVEMARLEQERQTAERQARENARKAQEDALRREAEARADQARPAAADVPAAEAVAEKPAAPAVSATPEPVVAAAPAPVASPAANVRVPTQGRIPDPGRSTPAPRANEQRSFESPRRDERQATTTYRNDTPRQSPAAYAAGRPARDGQRPSGDRPAPTARPGETVRYSALSPRPAAPRPGPAGTRSGPGSRPAAGPPATPEVQRATRSAPPGAGKDRRPDDLDEEGRIKRAKAAAPGGNAKAVSRVKGAPQRREGRLTIQAVAGDGESADRMRSLASVRRAREREREKRKGAGAQDQVKVTRDVVIPDVITVQELSQRMATRAVDVIKFMMRQGMMLKINDVIDSDTAELIATEFGHNVTRVSESDVETGFLAAADHDDHQLQRPPVVAVMGHVDHGKTSLLDALRSADVAGGEHGGITQHIGAYQVRLPAGERVTFLDTPGHAAFSAMRARGANVTDIVVLVVAADDGVMPQTIEAISHAKAAGAPIIVAVNKIDKPDADSTRVVNELLQHEIVVESLGGDTQLIEVSATKKIGLEKLIEAILIQAEIMDLKANPDRTAEGVVIEGKLDKGRGPVATVLVKRGSLNRGDIVVAGASWGRVRALINERDEQVMTAGPSVPVEILGLDIPPSPGEPFAVVESEARARELTEYRDRKRRDKMLTPTAAGATLADMMAKLQDKKLKELALIVKSDVSGSAEAIIGSLDKLATDEVRARIIHSGVGAINESDVLLAKGAGSPILGFNVRASKQARDLAEREGVEIRYYAIIYDLIDDIKGVLSGMLSPIQRETFLGNAEVLQAFDISKVGKIAGCRVTEGVVRKGAKVRIVRNDIVVLELGTLQTLKRFKDEVNEVNAGQECGMAFAGFQDIKPGDVIECFTVETIQRTL
jgi:translation initiation factor IF-2